MLPTDCMNIYLTWMVSPAALTWEGHYALLCH